MKRKKLLEAIKNYLSKQKGKQKNVKNIYIEVKRSDDGLIEEFDGKTAILLGQELIIADYSGKWQEADITDRGIQTIAKAFGVYCDAAINDQIDISIIDHYNVLHFNVPAPIYRGYHIEYQTQSDGSIVDNSRWLISDKFSFNDNNIYIYDKDICKNINHPIYAIDPTSLGEYIGIKDINETCIFTGDIILNGNNSRFVVEPMSKGSFHLTGASIDNKGIKFNISAIDNKAVVIGNIYNIREYLENNQNPK